MGKRIKKPPVKPEIRKNWIRRYEQGESIVDIAKNDKFDARTVRRHIELAKQEREVKEARSTVLRNALESHYADLCEYAERLAAQTSGQEASPTPRDEYMESALRHHLPRSPIWGYIKQREGLRQRINELTQRVRMKLEKVVRTHPKLSSDLDISETGVVAGIVDALTFQTEQWAKGNPGLNVKDDLVWDEVVEGVGYLRYGFAHMGKVKKEHVRLIREVLLHLESDVKDWDERGKLEKPFIELKRVEKKLKDELAVITLRRIVPGHCRFCPL